MSRKFQIPSFKLFLLELLQEPEEELDHWQNFYGPFEGELLPLKCRHSVCVALGAVHADQDAVPAKLLRVGDHPVVRAEHVRDYARVLPYDRVGRNAG